jgi:hypothetical protein
LPCVIAGRSKIESILSLGHDYNKADRLYMRGPEGRGEVEVAVLGIAGQLCLVLDFFLSLSIHGFQCQPLISLLLSNDF